jgi:hypothetical protein
MDEMTAARLDTDVAGRKLHGLWKVFLEDWAIVRRYPL